MHLQLARQQTAFTLHQHSPTLIAAIATAIGPDLLLELIFL